MQGESWARSVQLQLELEWALRHVERAGEALQVRSDGVLSLAEAYGELLDAQRSLERALDMVRDLTGLPVRR